MPAGGDGSSTLRIADPKIHPKREAAKIVRITGMSLFRIIGVTIPANKNPGMVMTIKGNGSNNPFVQPPPRRSSPTIAPQVR